MYGINSWFYRKSINQVLSLEKHTIKTGKKTDNKKYRNLDFVKLILQFYLKICFFIIGLQNRRVPIWIEISHYKRPMG